MLRIAGRLGRGEALSLVVIESEQVNAALVAPQFRLVPFAESLRWLRSYVDDEGVAALRISSGCAVGVQ
jgi:hypothetical protein